MQERTGRTPSELEIADLDAPAILTFLEYLETTRHNHADREIFGSVPSDHSSALPRYTTLNTLRL